MSLATTLNFSPTTPAAPSGYILATPQNDGGAPTCNESIAVPILIGDSGSGGDAGVAPAPPSGSAAAGKFLKADGTWAVPPGSGVGTFTVEDVTFSGTSGTLAHTPTTLIGLFRNGLMMAATSGAPAIQKYSLSTATFTLSVAAGSGDWFYAVYYH